MTYRADANALPAPSFSCDATSGMGALPDERLFTARDPRIFDYVVGAHERFERLRQCASQLGGLLVLAGAGGRIDADHPMLGLARNTHALASDATLSAKAPPGAAHHHHHMRAAAHKLATAIAAMEGALSKQDIESIDKAFQPLTEGFRELQNASRCLPGFELIDFEQGCCAEHAGLRRSKRILMEQ